MIGFPSYLLNSLLYAVLAVYFWRAGWHWSAEVGARTTRTRILEQLALAAPLTLHAILLYHTTWHTYGLNFGISDALSAIAWLSLFIYWLAGMRYPMAGMLALALPIAAVCAILPALLPDSRVIPHSDLPLFKIHLSISMLAYALLGIAALHAMLMALVERRLHKKTLPANVHGLPPLLCMERLLFQVITVGFLLLTLTMISGMLFSEELFHQPLEFNHKTVFAILSWGIFAALLGGRRLYGWRGRLAIRWTLTGFVMLLLAYLGSRLVLEIILHRY
ncbi:MAG TPA: cytochrome C biogenesis protein [Betaproteobacteria bacterium]|nr:cytochrome C biogenesis protein [Betaproteobacteria bacterium]